MNNKNKYILIFNIINNLIILGTLIYLIYFYINDIYTQKFYQISDFIMLIISSILLLVIYLIILIFLNLSIYENENNYSLLLLSFITISWVQFFYNFITIKFKKINLKYKKIKLIDITVMGTLVGMYVVLDFITGFIPPLPFFVTFSLKYIPVFFSAFLLGFFKTLFVSITAGLLTYFMPGTYIMSFPQFLLDYFLPVVSVSLASFFIPNINYEREHRLYNTMQWLAFITIPIIFIYVFRVLAGVIFWFQNAWDGYSKFVYSAIFNSVNTIFDYSLFLLAIPATCINLNFLKK